MAIGRFRERYTLNSPMDVGREWITQDEIIIFDKTFRKDSPSLNGHKKTWEGTWDALHPGPPYIEGGPFTSFKTNQPWYELNGHASVRRVYPATHKVYQYEGSFLPLSMGGGASSVSVMDTAGFSGTFDQSYASGDAYGASAYKKFKPKQEASNAAVFIAELRDLPRMLKTTAKGFHDVWKGLGGKYSVSTRSAKSLSDHWLNTQFGWVPFLSDLFSFQKTYRDTNKIFARLKRQNGTWQKRGGTVEEVNTSSNMDDHADENAPLVFPTLLTDFYRRGVYPGQLNKFGATTTYTLNEERVWFEARFKFWMPSLLDANDHGYNHAMNQARIYGARITPTAIYQLIPWTWLGDWGTNAGDVVDNVSTRFTDNLVSKYAYIMRHRKRSQVNDSVIHMYDGGDVYCSWRQSIDTKTRKGASPFGFNFATGDLSLRQISILAALGISRIF